MTERVTAPSYNSESVYRFMKRPAYPGQLRLKAWPYLVAPSGANDPEWMTRAISFWQLQAETFGLRFEDDLKLMVDYSSGVIVSAIHVAEVLPGQRRRDHVVPRVAEQRLLERIATDDPAAKKSVLIQ
jgi:hypothetical protein